MPCKFDVKEVNIEFSEFIAIFDIKTDIKTRNFEYMVGKRTLQISNIAINSLNSILDKPRIFEFKKVNIEFSDKFAKFDILQASYIRI